MKKRKRLISSLIVVSYLANNSINVFAEEFKNIDVSDLKNIVQTNETIDINVKKNNLYEVYLDGSKESSGSGASEDDPVKTFNEALDLVAYAGVIYVTGEVVIPDNVDMPDKLIYIKQQKDKDKGKLKFEKKLYLKHMLYIKDIEIEFSSNDKDCIFLNGSYLEMTNTSIIGKPNIFIGSENEDIKYGRNGSLNIINDSLNNNAIGNINLAGKDGHTVGASSLYVKGVNIEGVVEGENVKEGSTLTISGLSKINKINNINKVIMYSSAQLDIKEDLEDVLELYAEGEIKVKNGHKINIDYIYGSFTLNVEVLDNETLIEGNYIKSKRVIGDVYLSDELTRAGYRVNTISGGDSIFVALFNPQSSNIATNYAPIIKNLREIIIREGNTVDLKKGVEAWDFEDGDITEKIVFPEIDLESLPIGKHEVSYEVTDSDGNKTIMNRVIYVIKNAYPIIKGAKNITIKIGDVDNFDLLNDITVTDDKDNDLKPEVIGKIEKPSPGTNKDSIITYTVTDSDKNTTTVTRIITVTNQLPVIKGLDEIVIKQGETLDLLLGVTASDEEDGDITSSIVLPSTDISKLSVGNHEIEYSVTDSDKNTTKVKRNVKVVSNNSPVINGANNQTIKVSEVDNFDLLNGITVTDDHDNSLNISVSGKIEKPSPGTNKDSIITYTVTDSDGNTTTVTRIITVTNQLPVIKGLDEIVIKQGETLDLLLGVIASDEEDGDITKDLVITGVVDINKEGSYLLLYKVVDSDGNTTEIERVVIVEVDEEVVPPTEDLESLLPPVIAEAITNNLVSLISGTGMIDDPVEIEFNNISNDKVDSLLSDIKNLNAKVNGLENKNGYTFVNISILKESNSNTFKVSDFRDLKEEIHIVLKVKDEYVNIADKLRKFAENNMEDSKDDNFNSDIDNNTNKDDNISNDANKDDIVNDNISNDTNTDDIVNDNISNDTNKDDIINDNISNDTNKDDIINDNINNDINKDDIINDNISNDVNKDDIVNDNISNYTNKDDIVNNNISNGTNKDDNISDNKSNNINKDDNISNNNVNNYSINSDNNKPIKDIPNMRDNVSIGMLSSLALVSLLVIILKAFGIKKKINNNNSNT